MTDRHPQIGREAQAAGREEEQGGPDPEELTDVTHSPRDAGTTGGREASDGHV